MGISLFLSISLIFLAGCVRKPEVSLAPPPAASLNSGATLVLPHGKSWFEDETAHSGVDFQLGHTSGSPLNLLQVIGVGCAICDFDGDGRCDLFLIGQTDATMQKRCALFRNNGNGTFTDVTKDSGLAPPGMYMGCAIADFDNDGNPDIVITGYGIVRIYKNLGHFKFQDVTKGSGLEAVAPNDWTTSAACADIDKDGLVDIYIGRYVKLDATTAQLCDYSGMKSACGPNFYDPQIGSLYRNTGNFKFKDITKEAGLNTAHGKCLGAAFADVNGDGWPDLYLGNDEMPGDLFISDHGKHFQNKALEAGVAGASDGTNQGGMGVDFGDYNRDGLPDLFVTTFENESDSLYANSTTGIFTHDSLKYGLDLPTRNLVGFGAKFADFNNDGWLDVAVANGHIHDNEEKLDSMGHYRQPLQLFMQEHGVFADRTAEAGSGFATPAVGRGLAVGDLDNDGRLDVVLSDLEGRVRILMNRIPDSGAWLSVKLRGTQSNRMALGAKVVVTSGAEKWTAEATTGGSYLAANDSRVHFGLGRLASIDKVEVFWPSGRHSELRSPAISHEVEIREP